jgi:Fe-S cluster assembly iron-binding protein IscA
MTVTPAATEQLSKLLSPGESLQIGLKGGGCGGATLTLDKVDSTTISELNIPVPGTDNIAWADLTSRIYLTEGELDVDNSIFNARFIFKPPLGTESCGCGASIKLEPK